MDLPGTYESVMLTDLDEIRESLRDWDVSEYLRDTAEQGGPVLLRSLYLYILAETEWHGVDSGYTTVEGTH